MTGEEQALFDEYPVKPRPAARPKVDCCMAWEEFLAGLDEPPHRVWHFVHRLGHKRQAFSVASLAELAGTDESHAELAINVVTEAGWVMPVQPEYDTGATPPLWIGRLPRER